MKQARPKFSSLWLIAAAAVLAAALAGCTLIGDNVTGVSLDRNAPIGCVKQCNDFYKGEYEREQKLHLTNSELCQALSQQEKNACLNAESVRHNAAKAALTEAKVECQNSCARQSSAG